jgi:hypothetical protein
MKAKGSTKFSEVVTFSGSTEYTLSGSSGKTSGTQTMIVGGGVGILRAIGTKLFLHGDAQFFKSYFNISKSPIANKWVLVPKSNGNYSSMYTGILFGPESASVVDVKDAKLISGVKFDGKTVTELSGVPSQGSPPPGASQSIYLPTNGPELPFGLKIKGKEQGGEVTVQITFLKWGVSVKVVAPTSYVTATKTDLPSN